MSIEQLEEKIKALEQRIAMLESNYWAESAKFKFPKLTYPDSVYTCPGCGQSIYSGHICITCKI